MKTIFVSLSSKIFARTYALIPDSVVDLLGKNKDLRIVLLSPKSLVTASLQEKFTAPNFLIIEYPERPHKNILQRAFHFFYSFLIFTPTTKLVSSYGVRADRPRPLWRYWNHPFKWFIANVLGKSDWIKEKMVPYLYPRLFVERPYKYLFEKYRPDLVFITDICVWDLEFLVEAKRWGIRTIGMPANWDHLSKYYIPFKPDRLLVWSDQVKREALDYQGYRGDFVRIVGAPHLDFLLRDGTIYSRKKFLEKFNFPESVKLISYFSQGPYSLDGADYIDMLLKMIKEESLDKKIRIIIRPHPHAIHERGKYTPFDKNHLIGMDNVGDWDSLSHVQHYANLLYHSDVIVTTYSSVAAEGSIFDRPTIIAGFDGYKNRSIYQSVRRHRRFTHFRDVLATGGVRETKSPDEFLAAVKEYLARPQNDHGGRFKLRQEIFGYSDGKSSQRICNEILGYLF